MWGVGDVTAQRWYASGCRTLDDVRERQQTNRQHLTTKQAVGLKYFSDFEQRIPRAEVAECEGIVQGVVLEVLRDLTGEW